MKRTLLLSSLALGLAGCTSAPASIAPSTTPLVPGTYTVIGEAEGSAMGVSIIGIPVAGLRQMGEARDEALKLSGGDALINVAADTTTLNLPLVTLYWTTIEGQAVKVTKK
jgi:hypothetical protein